MDDVLRWTILGLNVLNLVPVWLLVKMFVSERTLIKEKQRKELNTILVMLIATIGVRSILQVITYSMKLMQNPMAPNLINSFTLINSVLVTISSWLFWLFVSHLNKK